ncbi:MAG: FkbM family methyltransferase [Bacteroidetes bacterium]|nr:FkbM family methyltransferase [Bacteroidota bacterium]
MVKNYFRILFELFKEKVRPSVHPQIYKHNKALFMERKEFYATFLSANDLVFDVGANLGNRVEVFLSLKNKVIAVEPQSYCFTFLKIKFGNKISLQKIALGSKKDKLTMYINSHSSTISSLSKDWINVMKNTRFKNQEWNEKEEVLVDTLDALILQYGTPRFIKIDVEGFEADVLKGLSKPVPFLSFEYSTPEQAERLYECLEIINQLDPNYLYNYSAGEKNRFVLDNWLTIADFKNLIAKNMNVLEGFGDIYARTQESRLNK